MPSPQASHRNLEKANAVWRRPAPWRSDEETRLIRRFTWRWCRYQEPRCSGRGLARLLGVSHTYVQKLIREFATDSSDMLHEERLHGHATFEGLRRAREETRKMRERGWLRRSSNPLDREAAFELTKVRLGAPQSPREGRVDPLVAVKHSLAVAQENKKARPVPFTRRWRATG
jgi:hypothetical protein